MYISSFCVGEHSALRAKGALQNFIMLLIINIQIHFFYFSSFHVRGTGAPREGAQWEQRRIRGSQGSSERKIRGSPKGAAQDFLICAPKPRIRKFGSKTISIIPTGANGHFGHTGMADPVCRNAAWIELGIGVEGGGAIGRGRFG
jgi:hypothetical protein